MSDTQAAEQTEPRGELTLRVPAMPANTNAAGDIFGGWIMGMMDMAAGTTAHEITEGRVATVAVSDLHFLRPVHVGDVISCYTELVKTGRTSLTIHVEVWAQRRAPIRHDRVTKADFVMVAVDREGKKRVIAAPK